ncbi:MAG: hypothetical protein RI911_722 [Candidatus Parcubacteria bacterium]|jgi:hypothetical protein
MSYDSIDRFYTTLDGPNLSFYFAYCFQFSTCRVCVRVIIAPLYGTTTTTITLLQ